VPHVVDQEDLFHQALSSVRSEFSPGGSVPIAGGLSPSHHRQVQAEVEASPRQRDPGDLLVRDVPRFWALA